MKRMKEVVAHSLVFVAPSLVFVVHVLVRAAFTLVWTLGPSYAPL